MSSNHVPSPNQTFHNGPTPFYVTRIHSTRYRLTPVYLLRSPFRASAFNSSGIFGSYNPLTRLFPTECCPTFMIQCPIHLFTFALIMLSPRFLGCLLLLLLYTTLSHFYQIFLNDGFSFPNAIPYAKMVRKTTFTSFRTCSLFLRCHIHPHFP